MTRLFQISLLVAVVFPSFVQGKKKDNTIAEKVNKAGAFYKKIYEAATGHNMSIAIVKKQKMPHVIKIRGIFPSQYLARPHLDWARSHRLSYLEVKHPSCLKTKGKAIYGPSLNPARYSKKYNYILEMNPTVFDKVNQITADEGGQIKPGPNKYIGSYSWHEDNNFIQLDFAYYTRTLTTSNEPHHYVALD